MAVGFIRSFYGKEGARHTSYRREPSDLRSLIVTLDSPPPPQSALRATLSPISSSSMYNASFFKDSRCLGLFHGTESLIPRMRWRTSYLSKGRKKPLLTLWGRASRSRWLHVLFILFTIIQLSSCFPTSWFPCCASSSHRFPVYEWSPQNESALYDMKSRRAHIASSGEQDTPSRSKEINRAPAVYTGR